MDLCGFMVQSYCAYVYLFLNGAMAQSLSMVFVMRLFLFPDQQDLGVIAISLLASLGR